MSNNSLILATFIKQMEECFQDVIRVFPDICKRDIRFTKCKLFFETLKMSNPRLMIVVWKNNINDKYRSEILAGDVNFFVQKDYRDDAPVELYDSTVETCINDLRNVIRTMDPANVLTATKYIQNLCKLADLYKS